MFGLSGTELRGLREALRDACLNLCGRMSFLEVERFQGGGILWVRRSDACLSCPVEDLALGAHLRERLRGVVEGLRDVIVAPHEGLPRRGRPWRREVVRRSAASRATASRAAVPRGVRG